MGRFGFVFRMVNNDDVFNLVFNFLFVNGIGVRCVFLWF